ncbi:MAG: plasmid mobilization relaxosome protein MobC [Pedobacter sp.]|nr:MAG: plasmid mobilization relaxosome protein MobC [Pedobacter sp.]
MKGQSESTKSWISFRVKPKEYETIHRRFRESTSLKLSEYARKVLLQKPVVLRYRNQSADDFLAEMLKLKNELNSIGVNFNQVVKKLHTSDTIPEIKIWLLTAKPTINLFMVKTEEILKRLDQIHKSWSSK